MTEGRRERHKADTRRALEEAALRRFAAEGYDATSVGAIAADAGVSARTFFRYFATKDEVLDMGRLERQGELRAVVAAASGTGSAVVRAAVLHLAEGFAGDRERIALRQRAAATSPVLRGRLFDTFASWEHALASALTARGAADADVLAAAGIAVFRVATASWVDRGGSLPDLVGRGFDALGSSA
ncbi:TetR family transcriptional regulator [Nocardioides aquiterrae]|uniref:TetR family transcriptional regulator n=1 Tax=Nocardioides aquiterrae TaxID=203799 RepID=A0ABP4EUI9_9ACTN